tara:strand:+ start:3580 stop:4473 length:894 start_codon:yes stop_codon:yes gene_type:complete
MTTEEILTALEKVSFEVPTEALEAAEAQRDEITPKLREVVHRAAEDPDHLLEDHTFQLHIYALYLLAKFREHGAYSDFVKLCNLPGEMPLDIAGDVLIEDGPLLLASVCDGNLEPIKSIAANNKAHALIRNAAIASAAVLYVWRERARPEVIDYYRSLFRTLERPGDATVWAGLITCCYHIQARELDQEIRNAYQAELVLAEALPPEEIEAGLMGARPESVERFVRRYRPIEKTAEAIAWWRCFSMTPDGKTKPDPAQKLDAEQVTQMNVGRNDPCPCGSGKKFKKCCGNLAKPAQT